ncbi:MAG: hypothetical protein JWO89_504, partial [Verrucomicrobiaceae bacterium]|nr:hypothetical protein [Verrucomicrobiaceae bacterium]
HGVGKARSDKVSNLVLPPMGQVATMDGQLILWTK